MNERIDQLLVKAGAYFGAEGVDYASFEPKKFAELIVRECAKTIEDVHSKDLGDYLKDVFGVEE